MITAVGGYAFSHPQPSECRKIADDGSFSKLVVSDRPVRALTTDERSRADAARAAAQSAEATWFTGPAGIADNDPRNLWGEVVVDGNTVARIYRSGGVELLGGHVDLDPDASFSKRVQQVIDQLGGSLVLAGGRTSIYA